MIRAGFGPNGLPLWVMHGDIEPDDDWDEIPEGVNAQFAFKTTDGNIVERTYMEISVPRRLLRTGTDAISIDNLPDPCDIKVNGVVSHVEGGGIDINFADAGVFEIELAGQWRSNRLIITAEDGERLLEAVRDARTVLLRDSDWTQLADAPLTAEEVTAWRDYRQSLRDVPESQPLATSETVVWPTPPGGSEDSVSPPVASP